MEKYIWAIPVNRHMLPIELVHPCPEQQYNTGCRARWQCKHIPPHRILLSQLCYISAG